MVKRGQETVSIAAQARFVMNSVGMIKRLAMLDQGVMLMPHEIVADEVESGRLRPILAEWTGQPMTVYALTETREVLGVLRERLEPVSA